MKIFRALTDNLKFNKYLKTQTLKTLINCEFVKIESIREESHTLPNINFYYQEQGDTKVHYRPYLPR